MAWAEELPTGLYRGQWRDGTGRRRSKSGFTHKAAALRFAGEQEARSRRGEWSLDGRGPTWAQWCERWLELRTVEPSTQRSDRGRIEKHIRPRWGEVRIRKIGRDDVQAWVNELNQTDLSPTTVIMIFRVFSGSMKSAVKSGHLAASPCSLINLPNPAPAKQHALTRTEFDLALFHMRPPYTSAAILMAGTGMRFGELAGLHWQHVDLENGLIYIQYTWDAVAKRIKPYPKSGRQRSVPIPGWVADELVHIADPGKGPCGHPHAKGAPCTSRLVLTSERGLPLSFSTMAENHWQPALRAAGIPHTRLHDIRHTYATWLRQAGVDLEVVQRLLGHGSVLVTQRYSHIGAAHNDRVLRALEGTINDSPAE